MEGLDAFATNASNEHIDRLTEELLESRRHWLVRRRRKVNDDYRPPKPNLPHDDVDFSFDFGLLGRGHESHFPGLSRTSLPLSRFISRMNRSPMSSGARHLLDEDELDLVITSGAEASDIAWRMMR
jgi:hypothetical protein